MAKLRARLWIGALRVGGQVGMDTGGFLRILFASLCMKMLHCATLTRLPFTHLAVQVLPQDPLGPLTHPAVVRAAQPRPPILPPSSSFLASLKHHSTLRGRPSANPRNFEQRPTYH